MEKNRVKVHGMWAHGKHIAWQLRYQVQSGTPGADHHKLVLFLHMKHILVPTDDSG